TDTGGAIGTPPLVLPAGTKVRHVTQKEIAGSGGRYEDGDIKVSFITPQYDSGGFTQAQLAPVATQQGVEIVYRLDEQSGATGVSGDYSLVEFRRDANLHFELVIGRE